MRELVPVGDESEHKLCIQDIKRRMAEISLIPRVLMALRRNGCWELKPDTRIARL